MVALTSLSLNFHPHLAWIQSLNIQNPFCSKMIRHFIEHMEHLVKMIFLVFIVSIFLEFSLAVATGKDDLAAGLSSREDMVKLAGYGEEKLSTVVINGKLLCHAGLDDKISSHTYHVSGATVAVFCGTSGRTKRSWAKGSTNSYGEFIIDLPSHLHAIPNLEKVCLVNVFQLPNSSPCRQAFTGKHKGIKLASIGEGVRIYTTQDIHLMPKPSDT